MKRIRIYLPQRARRQPTSETGIYLRRHQHSWSEHGTHRWPNGSRVRTFVCEVCGDLIADNLQEVSSDGFPLAS